MRDVNRILDLGGGSGVLSFPATGHRVPNSGEVSRTTLLTFLRGDSMILVLLPLAVSDDGHALLPLCGENPSSIITLGGADAPPIFLPRLARFVLRRHAGGAHKTLRRLLDSLDIKCPTDSQW